MTVESIAGYTGRVKQELLYDERTFSVNPSAHRPGELRQIVQCLELYYRQGKSQKDVAETLGVSAATVCRLLKRAVVDGLVRVELDLPRTQELETALVERCGLRDAVVIVTGGRGDVREELGAAAAVYFEKVTANGMRVGLSCGYTLYQTIHSLHERRVRDLTLYPLSG